MRKTLLSLCAISLTACTVSTEKQVESVVCEPTAAVYLSAKDSALHLAKVAENMHLSPAEQPAEPECFVYVDTMHRFQTLVGIGGAITDAVAQNFAALPEDEQQHLLNAYYDVEKGIGYSLMRTTMNSCDFGTENYDYIQEGDTSLLSFDISHDEKYRLPLIKRIMDEKGVMPLYVSTWTPPLWMKSNREYFHGGKLLPEYAGVWAAYFVKYIQALEERNIPVWGLSVQNEPMAVQTWESCIFTAEEERDFVKNHLGPALWKNGMKDKKLIVWDHNRDLLFHRASTILNDPEAAKYVWGVGYHWYETWTGAPMNFNAVSMTKQAFPDKELIFTEGCAEAFDASKIASWELGEKYAYSMINDFNAGAAAWTDWNILLDGKGGPNHVNNFCFAPVHVVADSLYFTSAYYAIGHFSKFIRPGAQRVACCASRANFYATAFKNTDGSLVVVVQNPQNSSIDLKLIVQTSELKFALPPHSIASFVVE
jgi:glucosylceramidase